MERLTNRVADNNSFIPFLPSSLLSADGLNKVVNKLAQYETAEEDGLLLRLPCKAVEDKAPNDDDYGYVDMDDIGRVAREIKGKAVKQDKDETEALARLEAESYRPFTLTEELDKLV